MGQNQSNGNDEIPVDRNRESSSAAAHKSSSPSMDSLLEEAAAFGNDDENLSLDAKAEKALECPCLSKLRSGPCGSQFSEAFLCFLKSTAEEKGSDCVHPFVALQSCIKTNPDAFPKDVMENDEAGVEEEPTKEYKIIPPTWSVKSSESKTSRASGKPKGISSVG